MWRGARTSTASWSSPSPTPRRRSCGTALPPPSTPPWPKGRGTGTCAAAPPWCTRPPSAPSTPSAWTCCASGATWRTWIRTSGCATSRRGRSCAAGPWRRCWRSGTPAWSTTPPSPPWWTPWRGSGTTRPWRTRCCTYTARSRPRPTRRAGCWSAGGTLTCPRAPARRTPPGAAPCWTTAGSWPSTGRRSWPPCGKRSPPTPCWTGITAPPWRAPPPPWGSCAPPWSGGGTRLPPPSPSPFPGRGAKKGSATRG